jgi:hypothetical protein
MDLASYGKTRTAAASFLSKTRVPVPLILRVALYELFSTPLCPTQICSSTGVRAVAQNSAAKSAHETHGPANRMLGPMPSRNGSR